MKKLSCSLLIGATGSAATLKIPILLKSLLDFSSRNTKYGFEIRLIVSDNAKRFLNMSDFPKEVKVYDDRMIKAVWNKKGDPILHVALSRLADIMVIAPITANTMAKINYGLCDNLVTCTTRSWDRKKPFIFCPAANPLMLKHPMTPYHIETLKQWGFIEVPPIQKTLLCGDHGVGAMADIDTIVDVIVKEADKILQKS